MPPSKSMPMALLMPALALMPLALRGARSLISEDRRTAIENEGIYCVQ